MKALGIRAAWVAASATIILFQNCSEVKFGTTPTPPPTERPVEVVINSCPAVDKPELKPVLMWDWQAELASSPAPRYENYNQVMAAPTVADLDGDRKPEVVFSTFTGWSYTDAGVIRIVDGMTGRTKVSIAEAALAPYASQSPLLVDIDNDGKVEIFYVNSGANAVVALNFDGSRRWVFKLPNAVNFATTGITATKLAGQSRAGISVGPYVVTEDAQRAPKLAFTLPGSTDSHLTTLAMPLDPSRPAEWSIVTHGGIYDMAGNKTSTQWPADAYGYYAAADLAPEIPGLEIVAVRAPNLMILNGLTGAPLKSIDLTQYNDLKCGTMIGGGPPSIGDFDGDPSSLEIAVATGRHLTIFDRNALPKYKTTTQDCSSLVTGLTSFDLNGDGKPEILYGDEEYFRIYEVRDGKLEVRHSIVNPTGTLFEYPVVADLSGTGNESHILVVGNNFAASSFYKDAGEAADGQIALGITGVRAFRSSGQRAWMPTLPIWNQYSFHPDLVSVDGRLQSSPAVNGQLYRRNVQMNSMQSRCRK